MINELHDANGALVSNPADLSLMLKIITNPYLHLKRKSKEQSTVSEAGDWLSEKVPSFIYSVAVP